MAQEAEETKASNEVKKVVERRRKGVQEKSKLERCLDQGKTGTTGSKQTTKLKQTIKLELYKEKKTVEVEKMKGAKKRRRKKAGIEKSTRLK